MGGWFMGMSDRGLGDRQGDRGQGDYIRYTVA